MSGSAAEVPSDAVAVVGAQREAGSEAGANAEAGTDAEAARSDGGGDGKDEVTGEEAEAAHADDVSDEGADADNHGDADMDMDGDGGGSDGVPEWQQEAQRRIDADRAARGGGSGGEDDDSNDDGSDGSDDSEYPDSDDSSASADARRKKRRARRRAEDEERALEEAARLRVLAAKNATADKRHPCAKAALRALRPLLPLFHVICCPCLALLTAPALWRAYRRAQLRGALLVAFSRELRAMGAREAVVLLAGMVRRRAARTFAPKRRLAFAGAHVWDYAWALLLLVWVVLLPVYADQLLHPVSRRTKLGAAMRPALRLVDASRTVETGLGRAGGWTAGCHGSPRLADGGGCNPKRWYPDAPLHPARTYVPDTFKNYGEPPILGLLRAVTVLLASQAALPAFAALSLQRELPPKLWSDCRRVATLRGRWGAFFMLALRGAPPQSAAFPDPRGAFGSFVWRRHWARTHLLVMGWWGAHVLLLAQTLWRVATHVLGGLPVDPATGLPLAPGGALVGVVGLAGLLAAFCMPLVQWQATPWDCWRRRRDRKLGLGRNKVAPTRAEKQQAAKMRKQAGGLGVTVSAEDAAKQMKIAEKKKQLKAERAAAEGGGGDATAEADAELVQKKAGAAALVMKPGDKGFLKSKVRLVMLKRGSLGGGGKAKGGGLLGALAAGPGGADVMAAAVLAAKKAAHDAEHPFRNDPDVALRPYRPPLRGALPAHKHWERVKTRAETGAAPGATAMSSEVGLAALGLPGGTQVRRRVPRLAKAQFGEPDEKAALAAEAKKRGGVEGRIAAQESFSLNGGFPGKVGGTNSRGNTLPRSLGAKNEPRAIAFDIGEGCYRGDGRLENYRHVSAYISRSVAERDAGSERFFGGLARNADADEEDDADDLTEAAKEAEAGAARAAEDKARAAFERAYPKVSKLPLVAQLRGGLRATVRADPAPPPTAYSRTFASVLLALTVGAPALTHGVIGDGAFSASVMALPLLAAAVGLLVASFVGSLPLVAAPDMPAKPARQVAREFAARERSRAVRHGGRLLAVRRLRERLKDRAAARLDAAAAGGVGAGGGGAGAVLRRVCALVCLALGLLKDAWLRAKVAGLRGALALEGAWSDWGCCGDARVRRRKLKEKEQEQGGEGGKQGGSKQGGGKEGGGTVAVVLDVSADLAKAAMAPHAHREHRAAMPYNRPPAALLPVHLNRRKEAARSRLALVLATAPSVLLLAFACLLSQKLGAGPDALTAVGLGPIGGPRWSAVFAPLYGFVGVMTLYLLSNSAAAGGCFFVVFAPLMAFLSAAGEKRDFTPAPNPEVVAPNYEYLNVPVDINQTYRALQPFPCTPMRAADWSDAIAWGEARTYLAAAHAAGNFSSSTCGAERAAWLAAQRTPDVVGPWLAVFAPLWCALLLAAALRVAYPRMVQPLYERSLARGTDGSRFFERGPPNAPRDPPPAHVPMTKRQRQRATRPLPPAASMRRTVTVGGQAELYYAVDVPVGAYWDRERLKWMSAQSEHFDAKLARGDPLLTGPGTGRLDPRGLLDPARYLAEQQEAAFEQAGSEARAKERERAAAREARRRQRERKAQGLPPIQTLAGRRAAGGGPSHAFPMPAGFDGAPRLPQRRKSMAEQLLDFTGVAPTQQQAEDRGDAFVHYAVDEHYMEDARRRASIRYNNKDEALEPVLFDEKHLATVLIKPRSAGFDQKMDAAVDRGFDVSATLDRGEQHRMEVAGGNVLRDFKRTQARRQSMTTLRLLDEKADKAAELAAAEHKVAVYNDTVGAGYAVPRNPLVHTEDAILKPTASNTKSAEERGKRQAYMEMGQGLGASKKAAGLGEIHEV